MLSGSHLEISAELKCVHYLLLLFRIHLLLLLVLLIFIIIELIHSKTILEITGKIEPQPAALDFKNISQYSSRSK